MPVNNDTRVPTRSPTSTETSASTPVRPPATTAGAPPVDGASAPIKPPESDNYQKNFNPERTTSQTIAIRGQELPFAKAVEVLVPDTGKFEELAEVVARYSGDFAVLADQLIGVKNLTPEQKADRLFQFFLKYGERFVELVQATQNPQQGQGQGQSGSGSGSEKGGKLADPRAEGVPHRAHRDRLRRAEGAAHREARAPGRARAARVALGAGVRAARGRDGARPEPADARERHGSARPASRSRRRARPAAPRPSPPPPSAPPRTSEPSMPARPSARSPTG